MRVALILLIGIHGLIHLFGFLKAFGIAEFNEIHQAVSKVSGLFWILTFLLFIITIVLMLIQSDYWWLSGFIALVTSQALILNYWADAKFGTIANLIILAAAIIGYSNFRFKNMIQEERIALFSNSQMINQKIVTLEDVSGLPSIIEKWLNVSGVIEKPEVATVYLTQELQLKLKPDQTEWIKGTAEQYFTAHPPAFNWSINTGMNPVLSIIGRDKFVEGKGAMQIKLLSLIPMADVKNDEKIDQATLQRYLSEIVWFPSASLSSYIRWDSLDNNSARATMEYNGTKGSGVFHFDDQGNFKAFTTMRYKDVNDNEPTEWIIKAIKTEVKNGIRIPTSCEVSWNANNELWTWLKLDVKRIEYNVDSQKVWGVDDL